jgi:proteic killer suppression protein
LLRGAQYAIICLMIKSFRHKGLRKFYETGSTAGIQENHRQKLRMRLAALDTAISLEDIDVPGFRLHPLKGDKKGLWAIDVSKNWRVSFRFEEGNVYIVDYEDYH